MGFNLALKGLISASTLHDKRRVQTMLREQSAAAAAAASVGHMIPLDCLLYAEKSTASHGWYSVSSSEYR